ncbi:choice-of-anchor A family protein [Duganella callida]|uniref:Choice-of-anchor A family protein n=2 Tax=Duganella callida TaxID=2561932 RepID=A0A4Y9SVA1_9BURK|nr:choice-of-anchor A family protein [Duganella callida]
MLQQFNVVVSGKLTSTSHVDGRTYVGGDVSGGDYVQHTNTTPASAYAGLTVGGSVSNNVHVNGLGAVVAGDFNNSTVNTGEAYVGGGARNSSFSGGDVWINGAASSVNFSNNIHAASYDNINLNNKVLNATTSTMNSTLAASTSTNFSSVMQGLSSQLSALKGTAGTSVVFSNNDHDVTFNGKAVNGVLVFDLTALDSKIFSSTTTDLHFNLTGASTVIFNTDDKTLNLSANFNQAQSLGSELIWNFAGANTSVSVGRTFGGQVLVADGTFSNTGGANVEGGVFAKTLNQYGEIHQQAFTGVLPAAPVPEPETYAMLLAGLGLVGAIARRRRK